VPTQVYDTLFHDGRLYVPSVTRKKKRQGLLYSIDGRSGNILWKRSFKVHFEHVWAFKDSVFAITIDNNRKVLLGIDAKNNTVKWSQPIGTNISNSPSDPAMFFNGNFYLTGSNGAHTLVLLAFDIQTGKLKATYQWGTYDSTGWH